MPSLRPFEIMSPENSSGGTSTERQQQISAAIKASVNGAVDYYVRRLPERDPRGDFLEVWDDLQKVIQAAHGIQVSHDELYEYFRRLKA